MKLSEALNSAVLSFKLLVRKPLRRIVLLSCTLLVLLRREHYFKATSFHMTHYVMDDMSSTLDIMWFMSIAKMNAREEHEEIENNELGLV